MKRSARADAVVAEQDKADLERASLGSADFMRTLSLGEGKVRLRLANQNPINLINPLNPGSLSFQANNSR